VLVDEVWCFHFARSTDAKPFHRLALLAALLAHGLCRRQGTSRRHLRALLLFCGVLGFGLLVGRLLGQAKFF
jgi:hypothetical protein